MRQQLGPNVTCATSDPVRGRDSTGGGTQGIMFGLKLLGQCYDKEIEDLIVGMILRMRERESTDVTKIFITLYIQ